MTQSARHRRNITVISGIAACAALMAVFLYLPLAREIRKDASEWRGLNKLLSDAGANLGVFRGVSSGKRLVGEEGISSVIDIITREGRNSLLDFKSISQENIGDASENRRVLAVAIEMEGEYKQLGIFFGALENIKDALVSIERFSIRGDERVLPKIQASVVLHIHLTKG